VSRSARREKLEAHLRFLQDQFVYDLTAALKECAVGTWGMFGQNDGVIELQPKPLRDMLRSTVAAHLIGDGESIRGLRQQLGFAEPFLPFERYLHFRQMHAANSPGEPKLAAQLLAELDIKQS
jgi:hypothetical protein